MSITVRDKEHWKNRITRKIDQAVEAVLAAENPNFMEHIKREAKDRTLKSLGIAELKSEVESIDRETEALDKKRRKALKRMLAVVRGVDVDDVTESGSGYGEHHEVRGAISRRQEVIEKELLAEDELGRRILGFQQEKEELLDTVWLATSSIQIKELWSTVAEVLNQEPTEFQKEALSIEPMESSKE